MRAMVLERQNALLVARDLPKPEPGPRDVRIKVEACGVCRTDLQILDGEMSHPNLPLIPGHEIVGRVDALGKDVDGMALSQRVGVPWLGHTCGTCPHCRAHRENLCDAPEFTGYTRNGGYVNRHAKVTHLGGL